MDQAHHLKEAKYHNLVEDARNAGYWTSCLAFEVGSRGLIVQSELLELRQTLGAPAKPTTPSWVVGFAGAPSVCMSSRSSL